MLIPKAGSKSIDLTLPKARPICLLDEIGKTFERIISDRLLDWMRDNPEMDLSENQYGFRKKRSTCDALLRVKAIATNAVNEGGVAIAIRLDIENVFNSLPWRTIWKVLIDKGYPVYLRRIIDSYLSDKFIQYSTIEGRTASRRMEAGVPQGSVLGPLLWNIAFDSVLTTPKEIGCHVICYANDTLIIATADCVQMAAVRAGIQVSNHEGDSASWIASGGGEDRDRHLSR